MAEGSAGPPPAAAFQAPMDAAPLVPGSQPGQAPTRSLILDGVLDKFKGGVSSFQGLLDSLVAEVEKEREEVWQAREQLQQDRQRFEEESQRVLHVLNEAEQVHLNVGGHRFSTTVSTLRNAPSPSLFNAMFSGRHMIRKDNSDAIFIDRDGRHFHEILNFLRDGQFNCPANHQDFKFLVELRSEADYYGLLGLVQQIDRYPWALTHVKRAASVNTNDAWMYEDGQDEVVFTVDRDCQLLGVGLCGTNGGLTVELEVLEVDEVDFSVEISSLGEAAQSFTKEDGRVPRLLLPAPVRLEPGHFYMASALIKGTESYCCDHCLEVAIAGGVRVTFQCWESPNGTNENRGQFPELYIRAL